MDLDLDFFGQDLGFFAGFETDLDLRSWQVPDLDLDLQIFLTTLLISESSMRYGGARTAFYFLQFPYLLLIPLSCKPLYLDEITRIG